MNNAVKHVDVAVIGAGLVGQAAALALAGRCDLAGLKVALVDAGDPADVSKAQADPRAFAITAASKAMLQALGPWAQISSHAQAMREIKVTDAVLGADARPALLYFGEAVGGPAASAHMVENHVLHKAVFGAVEAEACIEVLAGRALSGLEISASRALVSLSDGSRLAASLVVAADGRASPLRQACGIETVGWSYGQHGIVTTVTHERPHNGIAEEHFLPAGPFAILPLTGNRSSLVWTEESAVAEDLVGGPEAAFRAALEARFGDHLGAVVPVGPRASFPLTMQLAKSYLGERVVLVGDAAHAIHPLAGLGFNLGLRDAAQLSDTVLDAARLGLDLGSPGVLRDYEQDRRFDNVLVALSMEGLNLLFSNDNPVVRQVRDLGLAMVDRATPLKRFFMSRAAGATAGLPSLMRG